MLNLTKLARERVQLSAPQKPDNGIDSEKNKEQTNIKMFAFCFPNAVKLLEEKIG